MQKHVPYSIEGAIRRTNHIAIAGISRTTNVRLNGIGATKIAFTGGGMTEPVGQGIATEYLSAKALVDNGKQYRLTALAENMPVLSQLFDKGVPKAEYVFYEFAGEPMGNTEIGMPAMNVFEVTVWKADGSFQRICPNENLRESGPTAVGKLDDFGQSAQPTAPSTETESKPAAAGAEAGS